MAVPALLLTSLSFSCEFFCGKELPPAGCFFTSITQGLTFILCNSNEPEQNKNTKQVTIILFDGTVDIFYKDLTLMKKCQSFKFQNFKPNSS